MEQSLFSESFRLYAVSCFSNVENSLASASASLPEAYWFEHMVMDAIPDGNSRDVSFVSRSSTSHPSRIRNQAILMSGKCSSQLRQNESPLIKVKLELEHVKRYI